MGNIKRPTADLPVLEYETVGRFINKKKSKLLRYTTIPHAKLGKSVDFG